MHTRRSAHEVHSNSLCFALSIPCVRRMKGPDDGPNERSLGDEAGQSSLPSLHQVTGHLASITGYLGKGNLS